MCIEIDLPLWAFVFSIFGLGIGLIIALYLPMILADVRDELD